MEGYSYILLFIQMLIIAYFSDGGDMRQWLNGWSQAQPSPGSAQPPPVVGGVAGVPGSGAPGVGPTTRIDDKQSTLSRYWTMDRSLQRKLGKTNYQHIKRLCRDRGQLFEDQDFPPNNKAIYNHKKPPLHPILWMRPHVSNHFPGSISSREHNNQ